MVEGFASKTRSWISKRKLSRQSATATAGANTSLVLSKETDRNASHLERSGLSSKTPPAPSQTSRCNAADTSDIHPTHVAEESSQDEQVRTPAGSLGGGQENDATKDIQTTLLETTESHETESDPANTLPPRGGLELVKEHQLLDNATGDNTWERSMTTKGREVEDEEVALSGISSTLRPSRHVSGGSGTDSFSHLPVGHLGGRVCVKNTFLDFEEDDDVPCHRRIRTCPESLQEKDTREVDVVQGADESGGDGPPKTPHVLQKLWCEATPTPIDFPTNCLPEGRTPCQSEDLGEDELVKTPPARPRTRTEELQELRVEAAHGPGQSSRSRFLGECQTPCCSQDAQGYHAVPTRQSAVVGGEAAPSPRTIQKRVEEIRSFAEELRRRASLDSSTSTEEGGERISLSRASDFSPTPSVSGHTSGSHWTDFSSPSILDNCASEVMFHGDSGIFGQAARRLSIKNTFLELEEDDDAPCHRRIRTCPEPLRIPENS